MKSSRIAVLLAIVTAGVVAGCTESFDGGSACPSLCPVAQQQFRDTTLDAVVLDTSVGAFPTLGLSSNLLIANRPDTLVTNAVIRFDVLVSDYSPNNVGSPVPITAIDSVYLTLPLDSTARLGNAPVTLSVFNVDTTQNDSTASVVRSLFRPDRLLGSVTFTPSTSTDSLRIALDRAKVLPIVQTKARLRVGVRITAGAGQIRLVAFRNEIAAPTLTYDESSDTIYKPIVNAPSTTTIPNATFDVQTAYQVYGIIDRGSPLSTPATLTVGGLPAYRSYLRFVVPSFITDSSTIVRAELLLTQRPSTFATNGDTIALVPMVPTSSDLVTDIRRILEFSAEGALLPLESIRLVPRDSGLRVLNLLTLVRRWPLFPATQPRAIAFRISGEGSQPSELRFFSSEAAPSLRPRLRLTYLPRTQTALP